MMNIRFTKVSHISCPQGKTSATVEYRIAE